MISLFTPLYIFFDGYMKKEGARMDTLFVSYDSSRLLDKSQELADLRRELDNHT
jgi:hypothetical protein